LIDPHSAVGVDAAAVCRPEGDDPLVALATAHPAKFPDAVESAAGVRPELPARLADLHDRDEHMKILPNSLDALRDFVRETSALRGAA
jgi:threonine synthase